LRVIVYHGSYLAVSKPDTAHSRKSVDFGQGFYVTPIYEQAKKWAEKYKLRGKSAVISSYQMDEEVLKKEKALIFDTYSEEWLDFVSRCRSEKDTSDYEIVVGGVANDKVFNTLELYFDGLIGKSEAIGRLRFEKPNSQICFRTQAVIDNYLRFEGSETL